MTKKRTKHDSSLKKTPSIRKESKSQESEDEQTNKPTVAKRKLNLDLSSKFNIKAFPNK